MLSDLELNAIQQAVKPQINEFYGHQYSNMQLYKIDPVRSESISLVSLTGLVCWFRDFPDPLAKGKVAGIVVAGPCSVIAVSPLNDLQYRDLLVKATTKPQDSFNYGTWYNQEDFNIRLKCAFVKSPDLDNVIKIAGGVIGTDEMTNADDGFTQSVAIKKGVSGVAKVEIQNPVRLYPWRTFSEIEQPGSEFIFRYRKCGNEPQFALFAVSNNDWESVARLSILEYLKGQLPEVPMIG